MSNEVRVRRWAAASFCLMFVACGALAEGWPDLQRAPARQGGAERDAAVVVGIEDYAYVARVPGAKANALAWYGYLTTTLGLKPQNAKLLLDSDATHEAIAEEVAAMAGRVQPGGTFWLVFIGHGAPAPSGRDGLLVGVDAQQTASGLVRRSLGQRQVLALIARARPAHAVVVVDACFSGRTSTGGALAEGLQPVVPLIGDLVDGVARTAVLSAGTGSQFAGPLPGARWPAFSYLLLGALRGWADADHDGAVTAAEAVDYANAALSATLNGRRQTPEVNPEAQRPQVLSRPGAAREVGPDLGQLITFLSRAGTDAGASAAAPPRVEATLPAAGVPDVPASGPRISRSEVKGATGELRITTTPTDGVRLELTGPDGAKRVGGAPYVDAKALAGAWTVVAKAQGYADLMRETHVTVDEAAHLNLDFGPPTTLRVVVRPAGAAVTVSGPEAFSDRGGAPWEAFGLTPGTYRITVSREGYRPNERLAEVKAGTSTSLQVELERGAADAGPVRPTCPSGMVLVGGGAYTTAEAGLAVSVADFCLDVSEVTVEAWGKCVKDRRCTDPGLGEACNWTVFFRDGAQPINCVDAMQAETYCRTKGGQLPTELEWEWAARGGARGSKYPWGDEEPRAQACWNGEGNDRGVGNRSSTCAVGTYPAGDTPLGIHDLAGNVWEWTSSTVDAKSTLRVVRGGSWAFGEPAFLSASKAGRFEPGRRLNFIGFRCARTP